MRGEFPTGSFLSERRHTGRLPISHTPIRAAIARPELAGSSCVSWPGGWRRIEWPGMAAARMAAALGGLLQAVTLAGSLASRRRVGRVREECGGTV